MFKRILVMFLLFLTISFPVFADSTDKATLGGMSTTNGVYDWRVDSNGNLIPGTTSQNNIGSPSNLVAGLYAVSISTTGNVTIIGTLNVSGAANFSGGMGGLNWQSIGQFNQGINWQAIPQGLTSGINWVGADMLTQGINWENVRMKSTPGNNSSGTNWQAFGV